MIYLPTCLRWLDRWVGLCTSKFVYSERLDKKAIGSHVIGADYQVHGEGKASGGERKVWWGEEDRKQVSLRRGDGGAGDWVGIPSLGGVDRILIVGGFI